MKCSANSGETTAETMPRKEDKLESGVETAFLRACSREKRPECVIVSKIVSVIIFLSLSRLLAALFLFPSAGAVAVALALAGAVAAAVALAGAVAVALAGAVAAAAVHVFLFPASIGTLAAARLSAGSAVESGDSKDSDGCGLG